MSYTPGKIVWWELLTRSPAEHAAFYTELVGWKKVEWPMPQGGTYTMFGHDPETAAVAGMADMPAEVPAEVPAHWAPYVSVDDVDATCEAVKANGGQVMAGPFDIPDTLRMAVCLDSAGGVCNVMKSMKGDPEDAPSESGQWHWAEYYSPDLAETERFYTTVLGWTTETMPMPDGSTYTIFKDAGGAQRGGAMKRPMDQIPPMWLNYLHVDDCEATLKSAVEGGSESIMGPMTMPGVGTFAQFKDPSGAVIGIITPER